VAVVVVAVAAAAVARAASTAAAEVDATEMSETDIQTLMPVAAALGETWAQERALDLRSNERDVVGAWPGTLREARSLVLARIPAMRGRPTDPDALLALSRAAYSAARRSWEAISEPDPEA
jgi:hypothetical protein